MIEIPEAILSAAVALLQPYIPGLTSEALTDALKQQTVKTEPEALEKPMTRKEVAAFLQVSVMTVQRMIRAKKLRATKIGHSVRIDPKSVRALLTYENTAPCSQPQAD